MFYVTGSIFRFPGTTQEGMKQKAVTQVSQSLQYQVKTDTLGLGRSNKMQTNKPIITFKSWAHIFPSDNPDAKASSVFF